MMLYKRLREIDVPEMMASIIAETAGKPWDYYRDMSRQLWDEARHAMMGEVGFVALGVDWTKARITVNWSHRLNTECTPIERHAVLYFIEQGLMTQDRQALRMGSRCRVGHPADGDHSGLRLGRRGAARPAWPRCGTSPRSAIWKTALEYGEQCWSRILSNWQAVKDQGLTEHANWWPAIYVQACAAWNEKPDAAVLAFAETYEGARADLKGVECVRDRARNRKPSYNGANPISATAQINSDGRNGLCRRT